MEERLMKRQAARPSAVIADRRALERNLVRFLLEEAGYRVVAETTTAQDTASAVEQHRPDVVVVHENVAIDRDVSIIPLIRRTSPSSKVIFLVWIDTTAPAELLQAADAVVEEGAGIKELGFALAGTPRDDRISTQTFESPDGLRQATTDGAAKAKRRWLERLQGAVAASILVLAIAVVAVGADRGPTAPGEARQHLSAAYSSLNTLVERAPAASPAEIAELARILFTERAFAMEAGADVSALDAEIERILAPLLPSLAPESAATILAILGELVTGGDVPPSPEPSGEPSPPPEPRPTPDATTPPAPTETPSPTETPAPSETPSPTETPAPSETPSPTETPAPTETPSPTETPAPTDDHPGPPCDRPPGPPHDPPGPPHDPPGPPCGEHEGDGVPIAIASGIGVLVTSSGLARRSSRRRYERECAPPFRN
jgi:CheY-like chemotaxis protein